MVPFVISYSKFAKIKKNLKYSKDVTREPLSNKWRDMFYVTSAKVSASQTGSQRNNEVDNDRNKCPSSNITVSVPRSEVGIKPNTD